MSDDLLKPLNQPVEIDPNDPLGSVDELVSQEVPDGVDRRAFLMRSALIGATAIILGPSCVRSTESGQVGGNAARATAFSHPECGEGAKGSRDDHAGRVLQGGAGPIELAYHRPDAHHLRFLPALHEAARRTSKPKQRRSRFTCTAASAPQAKDMARSARRSLDWSEKSPRPSIPPFSIACAISRISRSL